MEIEKRRASWPLRLFLAGLAFLPGGLACKQFPRQASPGVKAQLLKEDELPLVMTRLGASPRRIVTSAEKVPIRFYFDPAFVDVAKAKSFTLWGLDRETSTWKNMGTVPAERMPLVLTPPEGLLGLRGSATDADGKERLVPSVGDEPALWLCVDRSPPSLAWVEPVENTPIRGRRSLDLKWTANELQFGDAPAVLEWSADRGRTWKPIAKVPQAAGFQAYTWRLPEEVCSDIVVRVVSRDLAGHEAFVMVPLNYPGSVTWGGPPIQIEEPQRKMAEPERGSKEPEPESAEPAAVAAAAAEDAPALRPAPAEKEREAEAVEKLAARPAEREREGRGSLLRLAPVTAPFLRGGDVYPVSWTFDGPPSELSAKVEWSADGGASWALVGEVPLAAGKIDWCVPAESGGAYLLRLRAAGKDAALESIVPKSFSVDADPPRVALGEVPAVGGKETVLPVAISDPGGSGLERVSIFFRRAGSPGWQEIDQGRVQLEGSQVRLSLADAEDGSYQLFLQAVDRAGNASPAPVVGSDGEVALETDLRGYVAKIHLDRSPPLLAAQPAPGSWVPGFRAELEASVDWTDAVPPLVLEGRKGAEGAWMELARWASAAAAQKRLGFEVPPSMEGYSLRLSVADAAGNRAYATVALQRLEPALSLESFKDGKTYPPRGNEKIRWALHPVAAENAADLRVNVDHQPKRDGKWIALYDGLPAGAECYWDLPAGDREEHRLRLRLVRAGKALGEEISPPFLIGGSDAPPPTVVKISEESIFYSNHARLKIDQYFKAAQSEGGEGNPAELDQLSRGIVASFDKALALDANNYHAAYGMAQFLNRLDPEKNSPLVLKWLSRTVQIKPDHFWALNDLGALYIREGQFARAEEALRRALDLETSPILLYNLALSLFYNQKTSEARERFEAALKLSKSGGGSGVPEGEVYYYLVHCHLRDGSLDRARVLFQEKGNMIPEEMRQDLVSVMQG
jgi:tetratricopeptide (TPR) repeat protein